MKVKLLLLLCITSLVSVSCVDAQSNQDKIYPVQELKPIDTESTLAVGDMAPGFILPSVKGEDVALASYQGKQNVVLSFVPAAWTPICSNQLHDYSFLEETFADYDATIVVISVDNIPTLYAWTRELSSDWFPVLSDFAPHGAVSNAYGVLRPDGYAERALFVIDKEGIVRYAQVHDINSKPDLDPVFETLEGLR